MNECPAEIRRAFFVASPTSSGSFPERRTSRGPDAAQNATPNLSRGLAPASTSCRSSTVLMKCAWPTMTLSSVTTPSSPATILPGPEGS